MQCQVFYRALVIRLIDQSIGLTDSKLTLFILFILFLLCPCYRCVKLTSPYLNVVIFIGAIFFYVDVILFGIDINVASSSVVDGLCQVREQSVECTFVNIVIHGFGNF